MFCSILGVWSIQSLLAGHPHSVGHRLSVGGPPVKPSIGCSFPCVQRHHCFSASFSQYRVYVKGLVAGLVYRILFEYCLQSIFSLKESRM